MSSDWTLKPGDAIVRARARIPGIPRRGGTSWFVIAIYRRAKRSRCFCDLFDETENTLVEAKGSDSRNDLRMALGQLADYARFEEAVVKKAILVPRFPRPDVAALMASQGVQVIWRVGLRSLSRWVAATAPS